MKDQVAAEAAACIALARDGWRPKGELLFVCTADEEAGAIHGAKWLCEEHPDKVRADLVINEGGGPCFEIEGRRLYTLCVGEKGVWRFRLRTHGKAGHASVPSLGDNALLKLAPAARRDARAAAAGEHRGGSRLPLRGARARARRSRAGRARRRARRGPRARSAARRLPRPADARRDRGADDGVGLGQGQRHPRIGRDPGRLQGAAGIGRARRTRAAGGVLRRPDRRGHARVRRERHRQRLAGRHRPGGVDHRLGGRKRPRRRGRPDRDAGLLRQPLVAAWRSATRRPSTASRRSAT